MDSEVNSMIAGNFYYIIDTVDGLNFIVEVTKVDGNNVYGHGLLESTGTYSNATESMLLTLLGTDKVALAADLQIDQLKTAKKLAAGSTLKDLRG